MYKKREVDISVQPVIGLVHGSLMETSRQMEPAAKLPGAAMLV
mgnify:CR=1 FL=1